MFNILGNVPVPPILYKYDGPPSSVRITTHDASGGVAVHDLTEDVRVCTPADFPCGLSRCDQLTSQPRFKTNRYTGLFRAYAYPALYPEVERSTRIR